MRVGATDPTEDPVRSQQTEHAVECVRVGAAPRGQFVDADKLVLNLIRNRELSDQAQASIRNYGSAQRPDDLGRPLRSQNQIPGSCLARCHVTPPVAVGQV